MSDDQPAPGLAPIAERPPSYNSAVKYPPGAAGGPRLSLRVPVEDQKGDVGDHPKRRSLAIRANSPPVAEPTYKVIQHHRRLSSGSHSENNNDDPLDKKRGDDPDDGCSPDASKRSGKGRRESRELSDVSSRKSPGKGRRESKELSLSQASKKAGESRELSSLSGIGSDVELRRKSVSTPIAGRRVRIHDFSERKSARAGDNDSPLSVGVGVYDITGPIVEIGLNGYHRLEQVAEGLHMRLFARAFVFLDRVSQERVCYVNLDLFNVQLDVRMEVLRLLKIHFGDDEKQCPYTVRNVMFAANNTHSSVAGASHYLLGNLSSGGFCEANWQAVTEGIARAIIRAHNGMVHNAKLFFGEKVLPKANINRSPDSYAKNPKYERDKYGENVDQTMSVLRVSDGDGYDIAALAFFPVRGNSYTHRTKLVSGDNKGVAEYFFEKKLNGKKFIPGTRGFVSAFAQTNAGDASSRTGGAHCPNGAECNDNGQCGGLTCEGEGPGETEDLSCYINGRMQYKCAFDIYMNRCSRQINVSEVGSIHRFVDMSTLDVEAKFTSTHDDERLFDAALGVSFASGSTDARGIWPFEQGALYNSQNPIASLVGNAISPSSKEVSDGQKPKAILINVQKLSSPAPFVPEVVPLQVFRIGALFLVGVPAELTTMAGRRLKATIIDAISPSLGQDEEPIVLVVSLANAYMQYITTFEEYQCQKFEGAGTLFGPHTLAGFQQEFFKLSQALVEGRDNELPPGPFPKDVSKYTFHTVPDVVLDSAPLSSGFGSLVEQAEPFYQLGDVAKVKFWGANPRNDTKLGDTFLSVEYRDPVSGDWLTIATDANWETRIFWRRQGVSRSVVTIEWEIPLDTASGIYRIAYHGTSRSLEGKIEDFSGVSREFLVGSHDQALHDMSQEHCCTIL